MNDWQVLIEVLSQRGSFSIFMIHFGKLSTHHDPTLPLNLQLLHLELEDRTIPLTAFSFTTTLITPGPHPHSDLHISVVFSSSKSHERLLQLIPKQIMFVDSEKNISTCDLMIYIAIFSLCAASRMWVRHRSVAIVPPERDLQNWWDSEMPVCWCFIHVTIKLVSGTTQRSVIESCITYVSSSPRETATVPKRENFLLVD